MFHLPLLQSLPLPMLLTPPAGAEFTAIIPGVIVTLFALLFILMDVFHKKGTARDYQAYFTSVALGATALSCYMLWNSGIERPVFFGMLYLDRFSLFFSALAAGAGAVSVLFTPAFLRSYRMERGEFYLLVMFSVVGMVFMAMSADLLTLFVAFEVMSIPIYVLAGFLRTESRSAEASLKYFILGAFSATLMLYGIALIYGATGTTNLEFIAENLSFLAEGGREHSGYYLALLGMLLIFSGFAFKVAAVPFHVWAPDVYTGSPTPVVGFMASAVKAIAFAGMIRVMAVAFPLEALRGGFFGLGWVDIAFFLAGASMLIGNLVAIAQDNVKRMLAYSSIAQAGYILVGFTAANSRPEFFLHNDAILFYLVAYTFGIVGAFGVLAYFGRKGESVESFADLGQLGFKYPGMGLAMAVFMFSAAGVPPTSGFMAKLSIFSSAVDVAIQTGEWSFIGLVVFGILSSVAGVYYYLRVLVFMFMKPVGREIRPLEGSGFAWGIGICAILTLYLGIFPSKMLVASREAVVSFEGGPAAVKLVQDAAKPKSEGDAR